MIVKKYNRFVLKFIPKRVTGNDDTLSRHKLFVGSSFIIVLFALAYGILTIIIGYQTGLVLMGFAVVYFCCAPFLLKSQIQIEILSHLSIAIIGIIYMVLTYTTGGITNGPMDHWIMLLPMLALLLIGYAEAIFWFVISITIAVVFFYFDLNGKQMPVQFLPYYFDLFNILSFIGFIVIIFAINTIFESGKTEALNNFDKKNHELTDVLKKLRSAQDSLIESEKLVSLVQLTAGIAHEIRNPLNFVTNFAVLSEEMIQEVKEEKNERVRMDTLDDITKNLQKISLHSKRAENIVRGMLQHSFKGKLQKEMSDVNLICHDVSSFAYHSIHSSIPGFICKLTTNFKPNLPLVNVVQSEISRVILNLLNNSFFAIHEKRTALDDEGKKKYQPEIILETNHVNDGIEIMVSDNGDGIPDKIKDKIFTPFFTTKQFGEGTGLGLSISFGIITKGHGGTITMSSKEGKGTTFTILLPVNGVSME